MPHDLFDLDGMNLVSANVDHLRYSTREVNAITAHFDKQADAFYTSGRVLDQGVIDPRDTRKVLGFALETCWEARHRSLRPNTFGVARM